MPALFNEVFKLFAVVQKLEFSIRWSRQGGQKFDGSAKALNPISSSWPSDADENHKIISVYNVTKTVWNKTKQNHFYRYYVQSIRNSRTRTNQFHLSASNLTKYVFSREWQSIYLKLVWTFLYWFIIIIEQHAFKMYY
jgi:hypothetical protein